MLALPAGVDLYAGYAAGRLPPLLGFGRILLRGLVSNPWQVLQRDDQQSDQSDAWLGFLLGLRRCLGHMRSRGLPACCWMLWVLLVPNLLVVVGSLSRMASAKVGMSYRFCRISSFVIF